MAERKLKPTEVFDVDSVRHSNTDIESKYEDDFGENGGKWLMFIPKTKLDEMWEKCCKIYDEGKLIGISSLKCSTSFKNPRSNIHSSDGVIRFYCSPASDQHKILEIGRNILKFIPYHNKWGYMVYKSNEQTKIGTRSLGVKINHLYKLQVPKSGQILSSEEVNQMITGFTGLNASKNTSLKNFSLEKK